MAAFWEKQSMIDQKCLECGADLTLRAPKQRIRVGRYKVEDSSARVPVCANGHVEISLEALAGYEHRAAIVVLSEAAAIGGAEIRFARKTVRLTQARLAAVLDVAPETVSRWENDHEPISRVSRLALLAVVRDVSSLERLDTTPAPPAEVLKVRAA
ncbi:MAG TPA: helix-turn-helix domain-containing protein [Polyangiaceae bacterium]|nr:helix-turn-helix domain-containing protein [Polyangiaceae bacterium]